MALISVQIAYHPLCVDYPLSVSCSSNTNWVISTGSTNYVYIWERQEEPKKDVGNQGKQAGTEQKEEKEKEKSGWELENNLPGYNQPDSSSYIIDSDEDGKIEVSFRPGNYFSGMFNLNTLESQFEMASDDDEIVTNFTLPSSSFF